MCQLLYSCSCITILSTTISRANETALTDAISLAKSTYQQIDGLVLNAGILDPFGNIGGYPSLAAWKHHFDVNFFSLITALKAALPSLRQSNMGGRVVFISTGSAMKASPGIAPYGASKAAMNSLCRCVNSPHGCIQNRSYGDLSRSLAEEEPSIVSVALRPGMVDTDVSQSSQ